jgi:hydrogenase expression/formation protein HypC
VIEGATDMCLGIPGRIVAVELGSDLAQVDVAGVVRDINLALLDGPFVPGEYILIHSGFALERMTPEQAHDALTVFEDGDMTSSMPSAGW